VEKRFLLAVMMLAAFSAARATEAKGQEKITTPTGEVNPAQLASQLDSGNVQVGVTPRVCLMR
jgi:hypothetical protein